MVTFDFWWKAVGSCKGFVSVGHGKAYVGTCFIRVYDRKKKALVGEWLCVSPEKPPERKRTTMDW